MTTSVTSEIPEYLERHVVRQDAALYTAIDHAGWRFILRIAQEFLAEHAHPKYLNGLRETGISLERIPLIEEMDHKLRQFGWRAVGISGFIPPAIFLEFLSLGILPIACDMRSLEHLSYTPAPDIVHEAAGHAPIIADAEYAAYLRHYGELARRVIFSDQDMAVYEAVRALSEIKEDPRSTPAQIAEAERALDVAAAGVDYDSEATELTRMGWWTTEYGLVRDPQDPAHPKIYGAGLLSSVGEGYHCLGPNVRKLPFSTDAVIAQAYDITKPQPQLFVAEDFASLGRGLDELAARMAYKRGGAEGLDKAMRARTVVTAELDSGLQISGVLARWIADTRGQPAYLQFTGPTQLAIADAEIDGQGPKYHATGFGAPIGRIKSTRRMAGEPAGEIGSRRAGLSPAELGDADVAGFETGGRIEFESGVVVEGQLKRKSPLVLTFEPCVVTFRGETLFKPEWGPFDLACGVSVRSVFGGAADRTRYLAAHGVAPKAQHPQKNQKTNLTDANRALQPLYSEVREIRETRPGDSSARLDRIHAELERSWPQDWLLRFELLELDHLLGLRAPWAPAARERLKKLAEASPATGELIARGLATLQPGATVTS